MRIRSLLVGLVVAAACAAHAALPGKAAPLPAFGADPKQVSVSGLSSGAFMAVQLQVAYSRTVVGAGVIAGGPYYCAANNVAFAAICMGQVPLFPPNPSLMADAARNFARAKQIDPTGNLADRKIYIFTGTHDSIVRQPAVEAALSFFRQLGVPDANLAFVNNVPAGHAVVTPDQGNECGANEAPYISHCSIDGKGYDQAGALLTHIYGPLKPAATTPAGQVIAFDQRAYAGVATAMADTGYVYVPPACSTGQARCRVHVAIHGCVQSAESVGDKFVTETGYNRWADTNEIIVLYPQVNKSTIPFNPMGCWDWWGYTGAGYAFKAAPQMKAIDAMVRQLTTPR